jgi:hypothetical protein
MAARKAISLKVPSLGDFREYLAGAGVVLIDWYP